MNTSSRLLRFSFLKSVVCLIGASHFLASGVPAGVAVDQLSINDVSIAEGNAGTTTLSFTVTRSNNGAAFSLGWATADSTAVAPGDYTAATGTLNFAQGGNLTEPVSISLVGDTSPELDEVFFVNLQGLTVSAGTASILDAQGQGTIVDEDRVSPVITAQPAVSQTVVAGNTFTLTASASGTPAPTWQW